MPRAQGSARPLRSPPVRWKRSGHAAIGFVAVLTTLAACGSNDVTPPAAADDTAGTPLRIAEVPPVSVPMALTEYLSDVSLAVLDEVGIGVWAGASLDDADTLDVAITIYGNDGARITEVVDRVALELRDRITVVETRHAADELEWFASEAQERLGAAGIVARVGTRWGLDAASVTLVTPDGTADPAIERAARDVLDGIPVAITSSGPMVPLSP